MIVYYPAMLLNSKKLSKQAVETGSSTLWVIAMENFKTALGYASVHSSETLEELLVGVKENREFMINYCDEGV